MSVTPYGCYCVHKVRGGCLSSFLSEADWLSLWIFMTESRAGEGFTLFTVFIVIGFTCTLIFVVYCSIVLLAGQAGALRHGISKALLAFQGDHCDKLERGVSFDS